MTTDRLKRDCHEVSRRSRFLPKPWPTAPPVGRRRLCTGAGAVVGFLLLVGVIFLCVFGDFIGCNVCTNSNGIDGISIEDVVVAQCENK